MKKCSHLAIYAINILLVLIGCTPSATGTPQISASKLTIKVGEVISIVTSAPTQYVTNGNLLFKDSGFLYSPSEIPITAPDGDIKGPYSGETLYDSKFPIDSDIEIVSPTVINSNLPPKILAVREGNLSKATFQIKGKSAGVAILRTGFLAELVLDQYPKDCGCSRTPKVAAFDGEIIIQVVP
jgi:hypothetical protein